MSGSLRLVLILLAVVFGGWIAYNVVTAIVGAIWSLLGPVLIIAAIGGVVYFAYGRKALGVGRRTLP